MFFYKYDEEGYYTEYVHSDGFYKEVPRVEVVPEIDEQGKPVLNKDGNPVMIERVTVDLVPYMPEGMTDIPIPQPNYRPRFDGEKWIEMAPKPEVPEGKEAIWHGDIKEWVISDIKPENNKDEFTLGLMGVIDDDG